MSSRGWGENRCQVGEEEEKQMSSRGGVENRCIIGEG